MCIQCTLSAIETFSRLPVTDTLGGRDREKKADTRTDSGNLLRFFFLPPPIKYHNIRGLFTHQAKVYCNDINGCHDNRGRVDDNILLRLSEQEITALFRIRAANKKNPKKRTFVTSCTFSFAIFTVQCTPQNKL